ncbi:hypothetical protein HRI_000823900 [Hibiscus trionum]|uniref:Endonuclease/exonuclease/phosphatase domain-containing protein n=1 Tax=Hibiscus trionum TaxID=183268 RepID=A0A9W7H7F9_HIBTR|nr:hypothetical protein HRI_000823900 [Hibiscus trionum]
MNSTLCVSWNTRGLGSSTKRAAIRKQILKLKPGLIFIQESKRENVDIALIAQLCGRNSNFNYVFSPSTGAAGGLITCWDDDFFAQQNTSIHKRFIASVGIIKQIGLKCIAINLYAPNSHAERKILWEELREMLDRVKLPILIGGDFNIVRSKSEKSGVHFHRSAMEEFESFIGDVGIIDLPLAGGAYTWSSNWEVPVFCRLDRFLLSADILSKLPDITQKLGDCSVSDHKPIILCKSIQNRGPKPFRWFDHWADEEGYVKIVEKAATMAKGKGIVSFLD